MVNQFLNIESFRREGSVVAVAHANFSFCMLCLPDAHARLCFVLPEALLIDGNMWDEAVITQKAKVKQLEDKFSAKMLESGVGVLIFIHNIKLN